MAYRYAGDDVCGTECRQGVCDKTDMHDRAASIALVVHNPEQSLIRILNVGLWTVATRRRLGAPVAALVFVFDDLRVSRHALLGRGGDASRREGLSVSRIWLREYAVDRVRPAVVVPDDLIRDMHHRLNSSNNLAHIPQQ